MTGRRAWALILFPAAPFLFVALAASVGWLPDPYLYLHGDVVAVALTFAGLFSGHIAVLLGLAWLHRRRAQRAVVAVQDAAAQGRTRLLRRLLHEIKNPLAAAHDELAELQATALDPSQQNSAVTVEAHLQRAGSLLTALRQLTDLRVHPLKREQVAMKELAEEVVEFVNDEGAVHPYLAGGGQVEFACAVPWELPAVSGEPELLSIALYNVVGNACKFTPPGGRVRVVVDQQDRWITVAVGDTGRGIPPADLERVGQELYRGQNADDVPGRGLGLAMARTIAERHGGSLDVQSKVGRGTIVTIRLPAGDRETRG